MNRQVYDSLRDLMHFIRSVNNIKSNFPKNRRGIPVTILDNAKKAEESFWVIERELNEKDK